MPAKKELLNALRTVIQQEIQSVSIPKLKYLKVA